MTEKCEIHKLSNRPKCEGVPALTYLGHPICDKCWDGICSGKIKVEEQKTMKEGE